MDTEQSVLDYRRVEKAIGYILEHQPQQPSLNEVAGHVHLSAYHFQRLFTRWAGISPKKFLQFLTIQYAKECLRRNDTLEKATFEAGLSGTGRLHDLFISLEGMTPRQYGNAGEGITLFYGYHAGPFGNFMLAVTHEKKICSLDFTGAESEGYAQLKKEWNRSILVRDQEFTYGIATELFKWNGSHSRELLVKGTPFQIKVWEALLKIPFGELVTYQEIASRIGSPGASQAVGNAIGKNPVAYLIPCHRVIRKTGLFSDYRWGLNRKSALIGWEASKSQHTIR